MDVQEFSNAFDTLLNSYNAQAQFGEEYSKGEIALDEYEKSVYLTKAQEEVVINLYNGKNPYGYSFESTEEMRRCLENLVRTKVYDDDDKVEGVGVAPSSVFYKLLPDTAFITMEQVILQDESLGCYNGKTAAVYPITQDEYSRIRNNPFRGPTKYKAVRLDCGAGIVELISKYSIGKYMVRYLSKPEPIILVNLPSGLTIEGKSTVAGCKLNSILHNTILTRAVQMALQTKGISAAK